MTNMTPYSDVSSYLRGLYSRARPTTGLVAGGQRASLDYDRVQPRAREPGRHARARRPPGCCPKRTISGGQRASLDYDQCNHALANPGRHARARRPPAAARRERFPAAHCSASRLSRSTAAPSTSPTSSPSPSTRTPHRARPHVHSELASVRPARRASLPPTPPAAPTSRTPEVARGARRRAQPRRGRRSTRDYVRATDRHAIWARHPSARRRHGRRMNQCCATCGHVLLWVSGRLLCPNPNCSNGHTYLAVGFLRSPPQSASSPRRGGAASQRAQLDAAVHTTPTMVGRKAAHEHRDDRDREGATGAQRSSSTVRRAARRPASVAGS
jgi:hypothetical protein